MPSAIQYALDDAVSATTFKHSEHLPRLHPTKRRQTEILSRLSLRPECKFIMSWPAKHPDHISVDPVIESQKYGTPTSRVGCKPLIGGSLFMLESGHPEWSFNHVRF